MAGADEVAHTRRRYKSYGAVDEEAQVGSAVHIGLLKPSVFSSQQFWPTQRLVMGHGLLPPLPSGSLGSPEQSQGGKVAMSCTGPVCTQVPGILVKPGLHLKSQPAN